MSNLLRLIRPHSGLARLCTAIAAVLWALLFLSTLFAYAESDLKPANGFSPGFVKVYALVLALFTIAAWVYTAKPTRDVYAVFFGLWRGLVVFAMVVAVVGLVFQLGPPQKVEPVALVNVIDACISSVLAIIAPVFINFVKPAARRRLQSNPPEEW